VGSYEVRVEQGGFKTQIRSGLVLTVGQQAVVNLALEVGQMAESVTVTGEAPLVNTTSGSVASLVNERTIAELPLNGRNYNNLTLLQAGVTHNRFVGGTDVGVRFSSNGAPVRSNTYLLDGANLKSISGTNSASVLGTTLGVDGIREYRI